MMARSRRRREVGLGGLQCSAGQGMRGVELTAEMERNGTEGSHGCQTNEANARKVADPNHV